MPVLQAQAALEQAVVDAIRTSAPPAGLNGYNGHGLCRRMYDGKPPPGMGPYFVSVWSDNARQSQSRTCLDEIFQLSITLTVRFVQPFDRWVEHRDELEARANAIRALIHKDSYDFSLTRAAMALADFTWSAADVTRRTGWCEGLAFDGMDPKQDVGPDWFHAKTPTALEVGIAQRLRFGKSRRIQRLPTMA